MKHFIQCLMLLFFSFCFIAKIQAQSAYSMHTIATGETLSVLAKNYHTTVGDIMRLNAMNTKSQLHIGDKIKIPAGGAVAAEKPAITASAPVASSTTTAKTHVVEKGETLYRLSKIYHISVDKLIALNKLSVPTTHVGQTLIVSDGTAPQTVTGAKEEKKATAPKETAAQTPQNNTTSQTSASAEPPVKNVVTETPAQQNKTTTTVTTPQTTVTSAVENKVNTNPADYNSVSNATAPKEGFFTTIYGKDAQQKKEQTKSGAAMTFKSASGWADKKYYILMNNAPTGSIVKITNGKNELYAKVLWSLGEMKENDGLSFRISTAAAAALGITEQKFDVKVSYYE